MTIESSKQLFLHEEILLLALRDQEGTITAGAYYAQAMAGAVLAELLLNRRIGLEPSGKKEVVALLIPKPLGDPVIDECLENIRTAKRRAAAQIWVSRFACLKDLKHRVAHRLCERGILRSDRATVLLLFSQRVYPEVDPRPEKQLVQRLHHAILTESSEIEPRTAILLSLAYSAGFLRLVFDKKQLKRRKLRIQQIANGEHIGKATREAIAAAQAAVMVTCMMPAMMAATVHH